jgi:hypothetical protein
LKVSYLVQQASRANHEHERGCERRRLAGTELAEEPEHRQGQDQAERPVRERHRPGEAGSGRLEQQACEGVEQRRLRVEVEKAAPQIVDQQVAIDHVHLGELGGAPDAIRKRHPAGSREPDDQQERAAGPSTSWLHSACLRTAAGRR